MLETFQTLADEKAHKIDPGKKVTWQEYIGSTAKNCLAWKKRGSSYPINWPILR